MARLFLLAAACPLDPDMDDGSSFVLSEITASAVEAIEEADLAARQVESKRVELDVLSVHLLTLVNADVDVLGALNSPEGEKADSSIAVIDGSCAFRLEAVAYGMGGYGMVRSKQIDIVGMRRPLLLADINECDRVLFIDDCGNPGMFPGDDMAGVLAKLGG